MKRDCAVATFAPPKSSPLFFSRRNNNAAFESDRKSYLRHSPDVSNNGSMSSSSCHEVPLFHRSEIVTGQLVGRGGFAEVFEIKGVCLQADISQRLTRQQQELRQRFAADITASAASRYVIKQLQKSLLDSRPRFKRAARDMVAEATYMTALDHRNILSVEGLPVDGIQAFADGRHDGFFIITERLQETLEDRIQKWRCDDADVETKVSYALQLADALRYLHDQRIIFRDLKPANIGFSADDDSIRLFDFGLCREMPTKSGSDVYDALYEMSGVGTRRYIAVEVINKRRYNCKADVYAWSMVFWQMLSLVKPYAEYSMDDHRRIVCEGGDRPPLSPKWSTTIRRLLMETWVESVDDRLDMKEAIVRLRCIIDDGESERDGDRAVPKKAIQDLASKQPSAETHQSFLQSILSGEILEVFFPSVSTTTVATETSFSSDSLLLGHEFVIVPNQTAEVLSSCNS